MAPFLNHERRARLALPVMCFLLALLHGSMGASTARAGLAGARPLQSIESLQSPLTGSAARVTVRGIVTLTDGATVYLQDETGGIRAESRDAPPLALGDEIQVQGSYRIAPSPSIEGAVIQRLWPGSAPVPLSIHAEQASSGLFQDRLVQIEGTILQRAVEPDRFHLLLDSGQQIFEAELALDSPGAGRLSGDYQPGSKMLLTGVVVNRSLLSGAQGRSSFSLMLRSTDDLRVLSGPPFWNGAHVAFVALTGMLLLLLGQRFHVYNLRQRFQAINHERLRLAREMHDTLAQEFTGIALQIQNAAALLDSEAEQQTDLRQHLNMALQMVRHSSAEAHTSIFVLRSLAQHSRDVLGSLRLAAEQQAGRRGPAVTAMQHGEAFALDDDVQHEVLRIGQEAITNVLRHAQARNLALVLEYKGKDRVVLTVRDDGRGFDTSAPGPAGQFGLRGLRERAARLHAELRIRSAPGEGTELVLLLEGLKRAGSRRVFPFELGSVWG